jgi:hypothetical protein
MREIALREFRTRGIKALADVPEDETVLLAGQQGPVYFLVPVLGDITRQDRELRRAMAQASLRENWRLVREGGGSLSDEEIESEIRAVRKLSEHEVR